MKLEKLIKILEMAVKSNPQIGKCDITKIETLTIGAIVEQVEVEVVDDDSRYHIHASWKD